MEDRYLYRAKRPDNGEWVEGFLIKGRWYFDEREIYAILPMDLCIYPGCEISEWIKIDPSTICQCTGLKDKNGKMIWENDILMCHGNRNDLVKAVFGEFCVINAETHEKIDKVIGWHYEVLPTDLLSRSEPFCLSMPLTEGYVENCEFEVIGNIFDNP